MPRKPPDYVLYGPWHVHVDDQNLEISIENIGPERAAQFLEHNDRNRPQKPVLINSLMTDMTEGYFRFNGDAVRVDDTDNLSDAQNRLAAIVKSGVTVPMLVIRGFDPGVMDTIDQGVSRTVGDIMATHGVTDPNLNIIVSIGGILLQGDQSRSLEARSKQKVAAFVEKNMGELSDVGAWAKRVSMASPLAEIRVGLYKRRRSMSPGPLGALYLVFTQRGADPDHVVSFFEKIAGMRAPSEDEYHTYRAIQSWLVKTSPLWRDGGTQFPEMLAIYATLIMAYNRLLRGERTFLLRKFKGRYRFFSDLPQVSTGE